MPKNFSSIHFATALFVALFAASSFVMSSPSGVSSEEKTDFLTHLFEENQTSGGFFSANMMHKKESSEKPKKLFDETSPLVPFAGEKSESLKKCMEADTTPKNDTQKIVVKKNPKAVLSDSETSVKKQLDGFLGRAIQENNIRWEWDKKNKTYTFHTAPGDEKMWWCYLHNESEFFGYFLEK